MSAEKMREEFEASLPKTGDFEAIKYTEFDGSIHYASDMTEGAYWGWQASRAAIEVELPERYDEGLWDGDGMVKVDGGLFVRAEDIVVTIESLGLRVKS